MKFDVVADVELDSRQFRRRTVAGLGSETNAEDRWRRFGLRQSARFQLSCGAHRDFAPAVTCAGRSRVGLGDDASLEVGRVARPARGELSRSARLYTDHLANRSVLPDERHGEQQQAEDADQEATSGPRSAPKGHTGLSCCVPMPKPMILRRQSPCWQQDHHLQGRSLEMRCSFARSRPPTTKRKRG